jgi:nitrogen fixation protein NifB
LAEKGPKDNNLLTLDNQALSHPCFDEKAKSACGRIHLPVAPGCNIQCGYCSRAFDCVNESRPGVTSRIMEPEEAVARLGKMLILMPYVTVAGIAGPGGCILRSGTNPYDP